MLYRGKLQPPVGLRAKINEAYRENERDCVVRLMEAAKLDAAQQDEVQRLATRLVEEVRRERKKNTGVDSFLTEYALSSDEGIALMCLAEALLRVPDAATIDKLIKDKIVDANWASHRGQSASFFVNATTWALILTGKVLAPEKAESVLSKALMKFMHRSSETLVRKVVDKAMRIMSKQFVMGRTIQEALKRAQQKEAQGYRYSYDMLGEAALTLEDAEAYFKAYRESIETVGLQNSNSSDIFKNPGISIKLSALHPRYQEAQYDRVMGELTPRLLSLAQLAKQYNMTLTVDAEESERLDVSLDVIERVFKDKSLSGWDGFGMAVQTYQKRAFYLLDWIADLAKTQGRRMTVRLIKGAYWDSEIKKTQMQGLNEYPVFTRKTFTDVSFQACAKKLLTMTDAIYPQFATHNAYSVALILKLVGDNRDFEFQCLHGMGSELYNQIVSTEQFGIPCRIYAPVGSHEDLLPYLVRRLLENGANASFVHRIVDEKAPISTLVEDPVAKADYFLNKINQNIPLPSAIFLPKRRNSNGLDLTDRQLLSQLQQALLTVNPEQWEAAPLMAQKYTKHNPRMVVSPQNTKQVIGTVFEAEEETVSEALHEAERFFPVWSQVAVEKRAASIERFAELLEENQTTLLALAMLEAGKTWNDGIAEVREAVDFCYYYAAQARQMLSEPETLQGYTGELDELSLHPRGVIVCISPWNFPLAIFTGQITAALVTGHCVLAKPAEQTPLIAHFAVTLMHKAGIPKAAIQLLPGAGEKVGAALVADLRVKGVIFTGSTQTASMINQTLATRGGELVPLIAETGGQNAMIVDSSALLEQVVVDVLTSAFGSAGQRCSALRVLYVQEEIYESFIHLLKGAMAELNIGNPAWLATDVGPVIDKEALNGLKAHVERMKERYEMIYQCTVESDGNSGYFMPPTAIAIDHISALEQEVFGPILHIISFQSHALDDVIAQINSTGYGLTLGIHSRINQTVEYIRKRVHVGNCYANRNMVGAVVGLQPFGGEGMSGTGPKAGGPRYLQRLCHERTFTVDTTAAGGNASLMSIPEV